MAVSNGIRQQLAKLCCSTRTRTVSFSRKRPHRWSPQAVVVPGTIEVFTEFGAWALIVKLLQEGVEVNEIKLDKPPDKIGYVILAAGANNENIYIKLEIVGDKVLGRSFHVSD